MGDVKEARAAALDDAPPEVARAGIEPEGDRHPAPSSAASTPVWSKLDANKAAPWRDKRP